MPKWERIAWSVIQAWPEGEPIPEECKGEVEAIEAKFNDLNQREKELVFNRLLFWCSTRGKALCEDVSLKDRAKLVFGIIRRFYK
jgi:hypothetical protein